jgi:hypothetical protein
LLRDVAGESPGWENNQYTVNVLISEDSLPFLANSKCELLNEEKLSCVSEAIEGIVINYDTSPAVISSFNAPIEFSCEPKDGDPSQWTINYLTGIQAKIPGSNPKPVDLSACGNYSKWALDSFCDDITNTPECNFDGGACCGDNVDKSYCLECECKETCPLSRSISVDRTDSCFGMYGLYFLYS